MALLGRAVLAMAAIVALQVVALEFVLRGWQAHHGTTVFIGIGVDGFLFVLALAVFFVARPRHSR